MTDWESAGICFITDSDSSPICKQSAVWQPAAKFRTRRSDTPDRFPGCPRLDSQSRSGNCKCPIRGIVASQPTSIYHLLAFIIQIDLDDLICQCRFVCPKKQSISSLTPTIQPNAFLILCKYCFRLSCVNIPDGYLHLWACIMHWIIEVTCNSRTFRGQFHLIEYAALRDRK